MLEARRQSCVHADHLGFAKEQDVVSADKRDLYITSFELHENELWSSAYMVDRRFWFLFISYETELGEFCCGFRDRISG